MILFLHHVSTISQEAFVCQRSFSLAMSDREREREAVYEVSKHHRNQQTGERLKEKREVV